MSLSTHTQHDRLKCDFSACISDRPWCDPTNNNTKIDRRAEQIRSVHVLGQPVLQGQVAKLLPDGQPRCNEFNSCSDPIAEVLRHMSDLQAA